MDLKWIGCGAKYPPNCGNYQHPMSKDGQLKSIGLLLNTFRGIKFKYSSADMIPLIKFL